MTLRLLALALAVVAANADAAVRTGTFAYDYRNVPVVSRFDGFEVVVLSARGATLQAPIDTVHAWGGRVLALVQPTLATWHGRPTEDRRQYPWDARLWRAARAHEAVLHDARGDTLWMFRGEPYAAALWDLGDSSFVASVAEAIVDSSGGLGRADGIVLDYGCGGVPVDGIAPAAAARWSQGWRELVARVRRARPGWSVVCQCDRFTETATPEACDGLLLERVGHSLNPPAKAWSEIARDSASRPLLRQEDARPDRRRLFAAIALLTDGLFAQGGDPNATPSVAERNPEHWELDLGAPSGPWRRRAPAVYERRFERGHVVANLSTARHTFRQRDGAMFRIPPGDGLVLQDRDAAGKTIASRTTR
jgi:hypothetical protein